MPGLDRSFVNGNRYDPPLKDAPQPALCKSQIVQACEASLRRLQTTYIDLYLIHWCAAGRAGRLV
jgi:aryl-alcohol dehydrogenase-like predicted oxidoreductase